MVLLFFKTFEKNIFLFPNTNNQIDANNNYIGHIDCYYWPSGRVYNIISIFYRIK